MIKESTPDLCAVINREQSQKLFSITAGNFLSTGSQIQRADHHKAESQEKEKKEKKKKREEKQTERWVFWNPSVKGKHQLLGREKVTSILNINENKTISHCLLFSLLISLPKIDSFCLPFCVFVPLGVRGVWYTIRLLSLLLYLNSIVFLTLVSLFLSDEQLMIILL